MLKYYVYISRTKVDMLYPQIPPDALAAAEAEVKLSLGVISTGFRKRRPEPSRELAARASVVAAYIRKHEDVGTPQSPQAWSEAVTPLRWGVVHRYASDIALFAGQVGDVTVALLGSSTSIVGTSSTTEAQHGLFYYTLEFFNTVLERDALVRQEPPYYTWPDAVEIGMGALPQTPYNMEFLARVVHTENSLVIASPLYVALT